MTTDGLFEIDIVSGTFGWEELSIILGSRLLNKWMPYWAEALGSEKTAQDYLLLKITDDWWRAKTRGITVARQYLTGLHLDTHRAKTLAATYPGQEPYVFYFYMTKWREGAIEEWSKSNMAKVLPLVVDGCRYEWVNILANNDVDMELMDSVVDGGVRWRDHFSEKWAQRNSVKAELI